ncbi:MAG: RDD family protein [Pseudomonadales bacterium]
MQEISYAGFWIRTGAAVIDSFLILLLIVPLLSAIYGEAYWSSESMFQGTWDVLLNYIFPAVVVVTFWIYKSATPGKLLLKLSIVDSETGGQPRTQQFVIRYLGYFVASIPLFIGIIWVALDPRKQGWHDKLAGTVVIREHRGSASQGADAS